MKHIASFCLLLILFVLPAVGVAAANPPAYGQEITLAATTSDERITALAYNSLRSEMLVLWQVDSGNGNYDLWARRARYQGGLQWQGDAFAVAASATSERMAAVAYNSSDDDYLVVYEYQFSDNDYDIYGQRVAGLSGSGDNGGELKGGPFAIGSTVGKEQSPDVIYLPASQQFLVVYELDGDIWARRVARQHLGDNNGELIGTEFAVAADFDHEEAQPRVQASTQQGYFLVTYAYAFADGDWDIRGQRVRGMRSNGSQLIDNAFDIAFTSDSETRPAVGYAQDAQAFIVVWQAEAATNSDVRGAWLDERITEGDPVIGAPFVISEDALALERQPDVDVDPATGDVVVVLSYKPDDPILPLIGTVWLNPDPTAIFHILRPLSLYA